MFIFFSLGVWKSSKNKIGTQLVEHPWEHSQTLLTSTFPAEIVHCVAQPTGNGGGNGTLLSQGPLSMPMLLLFLFLLVCIWRKLLRSHALK